MWAAGCRSHVSDFDALARVVPFFFFLAQLRSFGVALRVCQTGETVELRLNVLSGRPERVVTNCCQAVR